MSLMTHKTIPEIALRAPDQLGQAFARVRKNKDLTQASLARSAGVRQATVSKVEKGLGSTEVQTIFALCAALGLELILRPRGSSKIEFRLVDVS